MSAKTMGGFLVALVVGVGIGFALNGGAGEDATKQTADVDALRQELLDAQADASRLAAEIERVRRRSADADVELANARKALAEIEAEQQVAAERAAAEAAAADTAEEAVSEASAGMAFPENAQRYSFPEYDEALREVDWAEVGDNASKMLPALAKLVQGIAGGEQPDPETVGSIQKYNGALVIVALKLNQKLPGGQANGAYTHPAAMVNSIAATLEAAGLPLTEAQHAALARIGERYSADEKKRVERYDDETLELEKLVEESRLKHAFFTAAFEELNQEQRDTLSPTATRGRTRVDLFSEGLIWAASTGLIPFTDRDSYTTAVESRIQRALGLADDQKAEAGTLISGWVSSLPNKLFVVEPDALWDAAMVPASFVEEVAGYQVELQKRLMSGLELTDAARKRLHDSRGVMIPYLKQPSADE